MSNFCEKVKFFFIDVKNKIVIFFEKLKNSFCEFFKSLRNKVLKFFEKHKNSKTQKDSNLKAEPEESKIKKSVGKKIGFVFLNFFDVVFDLVFAAVIILRLKPELMNGDSLCNRMSIIDFVKSNLESDFLFLVFLSALLSAYFIFKLIFSFIYVRGLQRISCAMIVVLSIVSIFLLPTSTLFFLLFYFLLYITFQISCGIKPSCSIYKLIAVIVLDVALYLELHLIFITEIQKSMINIKESLFTIIGYLKI